MLSTDAANRQSAFNSLDQLIYVKNQDVPMALMIGVVCIPLHPHFRIGVRGPFFSFLHSFSFFHVFFLHFFFIFHVFQFFHFFNFFVFFFPVFSIFSLPEALPWAPLGSSKNIAFSYENLNFKAQIWVREEARKKERKKKKKKKKKKEEERADRNSSPSTIARTGPFCYSRAWKPLTPIV